MTAPDKSALTPELKAWIDRVIVPALVREWLAENNPLAPEPEPVAECAATEEATPEGVR